MAVEVLEVVTVTIIVGVMPLRGVVGEGIGKSARMRRPQIGGVGEAVFVDVPATCLLYTSDAADD